MPLLINERTVSRLDERPLHRQLADHIRSAITSGDLRPDEPLPSEAELRAAAEVSSTVVRDALAMLVNEGLIVKRSGLPTRVARPAPVRHMATARYAREIAILERLRPGEPHPETSAFTEEHGAIWQEYSVQASYQEDVAGPEDARHLAVDVGTPVLRRRLLKVVRDQPVQLQDSVIPLRLVAGTEVAKPERQPWPGGTIAELWSVGLRVREVVEEARARTPNTAERISLGMDTAGPVFDILRIFAAVPARDPGSDPFPVEVSTVVLPAAGVILRWETTLGTGL